MNRQRRRGLQRGSGSQASCCLPVSNPPTQAQVQALTNKIDELLLLLKRAV
jgi:hypothetical protein